jgi:ribosome biogenesis GTPase A
MLIDSFKPFKEGHIRGAESKGLVQTKRFIKTRVPSISTMESPQDIQKFAKRKLRKVVIAGEPKTGKTSILLVQSHKPFPEIHVPTVFEVTRLFL